MGKEKSNWVHTGDNPDTGVPYFKWKKKSNKPGLPKNSDTYQQLSQEAIDDIDEYLAIGKHEAELIEQEVEDIRKEEIEAISDSIIKQRTDIF